MIPGLRAALACAAIVVTVGAPATAALAATAGAASRPDRSGNAALPEPDPVLRDLIGFRVRYRELLRRHAELVRTVRVPYLSSEGVWCEALLVLPRWYGTTTHPPIPLVISPHGRGVTPEANASGAARRPSGPSRSSTRKATAAS
jgi:hypothetical protein